MERKENIIAIKADAYTDRIVRLYKYLKDTKDEHVISKQIYRSGTSIGANIAEGEYAQSRPDWISKLSIALKEANETDYWLRKLYTAKILTEKQYLSLHNDNEEIIKLLVSIIKTSKEQ